MIKISVDNVETMEPSTLRRISGLFAAIAAYADTCKMPKASMSDSFGTDNMVPPPLEEMDPTHTLAEDPFASTLVEQAYDGPAMDTTLRFAAGIETDSAGIPWDGRIHASTRAKITDGTWRMRRAVDPSVVTAIEAQIRQTSSVPPAPVPVPVPLPPFVPSVVPPVPQANFIPVISAGAVASAFPSDQPIANHFPALMKGITGGYAAKTITQEMIAQALQAVGVPALPMLVHRQDMIPLVALTLGITL